MEETKNVTYFVICHAKTLPCVICAESSSECMSRITERSSMEMAIHGCDGAVGNKPWATSMQGRVEHGQLRVFIDTMLKVLG